ncbi:hypothetical protein ACAW74_20840 [Fibrella sp. WM1]|uniref:hypothetical protein n=1 Tax=Fibrella musci TaxID=3242485 RepID=UPI00352248A6
MRSFALRWIGISIVSLIVMVSFTPSWERALARRGWIADQYQFGDLYNMTNVARFKEQGFHVTDQLDSADLPDIKQAGVHLYTIGDSFTDIDTSFYPAEKNVHVWIGNGRQTIKLDSTKRNILVIQIIERVLQERFLDQSWQLYTTNALVDSSRVKPPVAKPTSWVSNLLNTRFGSDLNSRLEFMLFNNKLALKAKECKAGFMLDWFDRTSGARLSANKQHAFYDSEVDTTKVLSSFRHIKEQDINAVVKRLNYVTAYYRKLGFQEVYLTLIPNKSTVLAPTLGVYNHQIERIERHPDLQPTVISTINTIRQHPNWYHLGDGHWTREGRRYWMGIVNNLVRTTPCLMADMGTTAGQDKQTGRQ